VRVLATRGECKLNSKVESLDPLSGLVLDVFTIDVSVPMMNI
jgi:hypothetical protein